MQRRIAFVTICLLAATTAACGDDAAPAADAAPDIDAPDEPDAADDVDAAPGGCLVDGHTAGERYPMGDECNVCECNANGNTTCSTRVCPPTRMECTYDGIEHAYGERFDSTDGCNACVCAASGLACTRRACKGALEEGAILLESLDEPCGDDETFTAQAVLDGIPYTSIVDADYLYETEREQYPETLEDSQVSVHIYYTDGFAVCRIPNPDQEAIDMEILLDWVSADGAFDEGYHTYLRRNRGGFVNAWFVGAGSAVGTQNGTYDPACLDPIAITVDATIDADGTAGGAAYKICETDIQLPIATFTVE